jgi:hypothetical protein
VSGSGDAASAARPAAVAEDGPRALAKSSSLPCATHRMCIEGGSRTLLMSDT